MFTHIRLKNYKSLIDLDVDFEKKKNHPKKAIIIYGENGSGKSNFVSAFYTLYQSMQTLSLRKKIQSLLENDEKNDDDISFLKFMLKTSNDTEMIIKECKTIYSTDNMELQFDFIIGDKCGSYLLVYDDKEIVEEKLSYVLNKNKCLLFDLTKEKKIINKKIFLDEAYASQIHDYILQYEGKHTLLSILVNEREEKSKKYIEMNFHEALNEVLSFLKNVSVKVKSGTGERGKVMISHSMMSQLDSGKISLKNETELNNTETVLNEFFTHLYTDIKEVFYKKKIENEKIEFELYFKKNLYGKIVDVPYHLESTGTQHLLNLFPYLLMAIEGNVVVIDELDTGIHDLLVHKILNDIIPSIKGQFIITTHNTMLLDSNISPEYIYTFLLDKNANKELVAITEFENRTHPNLNYRNRYLKGMYGGIPHMDDIDFDELHDMLDEF